MNDLDVCLPAETLFCPFDSDSFPPGEILGNERVVLARAHQRYHLGQHLAVLITVKPH